MEANYGAAYNIGFFSLPQRHGLGLTVRARNLIHFSVAKDEAWCRMLFVHAWRRLAVGAVELSAENDSHAQLVRHQQEKRKTPIGWQRYTSYRCIGIRVIWIAFDPCTFSKANSRQKKEKNMKKNKKEKKEKKKKLTKSQEVELKNPCHTRWHNIFRNTCRIMNYL